MRNIIKTIIEIEADALARFHGIKDNKRVRAIMERIASDCLGSLAPNGVDKRHLVYEILHSPTCLDEALVYLPPEQALSAFESFGPLVLSRRSQLLDYLADPATPFYTLGELADLLKEFLTHLELNRDFLIRTGFPRTSFEKSKWLDYHLSHLYFVKLPVCLQANRSPIDQKLAEAEVYGSAERDAEGNLIYRYSWVNRCPLSGPLGWSKDGPFISVQTGSFVHSSPLGFCEYEEAGRIEGLSLDIVQRLEKERTKYFKLKIDIINTILNCIRSSPDPKDVWEESLKTLSEAFLQQEMYFYLRVDAIFSQLRVGYYLDSLYNRMPTANLWGGMSNLIYIVGHFEKEITIGTFDKTRSRILEQLRDFGPIESYFQVVGTPIQSDVDRTLDAFWDLESREKDFWMGFQKHVNMALETEFEVEVEIRARVKAKHADRYKVFVQTFSDWQARHIAETGKFASVNGSLRRGRITTVLTNIQEKDYEEFEYRCFDGVHIPGSIARKRSNLIVINDYEIRIGDSIFILFLRFVVELKKKKGGWVNIYTLQSEGIITDPLKYQIYSNLRTALVGSLLDKEREKFIQSDRSKNYRVSTHPDLVTYDRKKLLKHPDQRVRQLAKKLR